MTADMSAETIGSRSLFFLLSSELLQDLRTSLSCSVMLGHYVITVDDNDTDARLRRSQVEIDFFFFSFAFRVVGACKWGVNHFGSTRLHERPAWFAAVYKTII